MRAVFIVLGACIGVLSFANLDREPDPPPAPAFADPLSAPEMSIEILQGEVRVAGSSVSARHEDMLRQIVEKEFSGRHARFDFRPSVLAGPHWMSASAGVLYMVAALDTAVATLRPGSITVRGVTSHPGVFRSREAYLRNELPPGTSVSTDILTVRSRASLGELCLIAFDSLLMQPLTFFESGTEIRDASAAVVDRVTDFARDCQDVSIEIRGHSDASGDETWNRRLSLARAQAVADRIIANGIDPERLIVSGVGSAEPVADNATARGREANRRIEFELRQSSATSSGDSSPSSAISNTSVAPGGMTLPAPRSP
jgi:OOP family OmpA-OmpF porin